MKDLHILIRNLPEDADKILNLLAAARPCAKHVIIREALVEYTDKHRKDVGAAVRKDNGR